HIHDWHMPTVLAWKGGEELLAAGLLQPFDHSPFNPIPNLTLTPIHVRHDRQGSNGFLGETPYGSFGYATDLGCVPPALIERFAGVDVVAIESNYDPAMQKSSDRPASLKRRVMGEAGHLSNFQAFDAIRNI